mmetsp:Transcript_12632/g.24040  ORF Transcript_12632/g.24040 Transcript_12632/m.24040 type:complete len:1810 (+) Transcript_12632:137-5566(+)
MAPSSTNSSSTNKVAVALDDRSKDNTSTPPTAPPIIMKSVKQEIQSLRKENATLLEDVKTLKEDVHDVKALLLHNSINRPDADGGVTPLLRSVIDPPTAEDEENDADGSLSSTRQGTAPLGGIADAAVGNDYDYDNMVLYSLQPTWDWRSPSQSLSPSLRRIIATGISTADTAGSGYCSDLATVEDDVDSEDDEIGRLTYIETPPGEDEDVESAETESLLLPDDEEKEEDNDLKYDQEEELQGDSDDLMSTLDDGDDDATAASGDDDGEMEVTVSGGSGRWWELCKHIIFDSDASRYEEDDDKSQDEASPEDEEDVDEDTISLADNEEKFLPNNNKLVDYRHDAARGRDEEAVVSPPQEIFGRCSDEKKMSSSFSETETGLAGVSVNYADSKMPATVPVVKSACGGSSSRWGYVFDLNLKGTRSPVDAAAANKRRRNARKRRRRRIRRKMTKQEGGEHPKLMSSNSMLSPPTATRIFLGRLWKRSLPKISLIGMISIALLVSMTFGHEGTMDGNLSRSNTIPTTSSDHSSLPVPGSDSGTEQDWQQQGPGPFILLTPNTIKTRTSTDPRSLRLRKFHPVGNYGLNQNKPSGQSESLVSGSQISAPMTPKRNTDSPHYVCDDDPMECGCPLLNQVDYRGDTSLTESNYVCQRWDTQSPHKHPHQPENQADTSYLAENYCRNPDNDPSGPWCYTNDPQVRFGYCSVPTCGAFVTKRPTLSPTDAPVTDAPVTEIPTHSLAPSPVNGTIEKPTVKPTVKPTRSPSLSPSHSPSSAPSSRPSLSISPTKQCPKADTSQCGCPASSQGDYRGTLSESARGITCEQWDAAWIIDELGFQPDVEFPDSGLLTDGFARKGHNFCRNPTKDEKGTYCLSKGSFEELVAGGGFSPEDNISGNSNSTQVENTAAQKKMEMISYEYCDVPACDPCSCMPPCGTPNLESCGCPSFFQSEECCTDANDEADTECKCRLLKEACRKSLENGHTEFCEDADVACCGEASSFGSCKCELYDRMCDEFPFRSMCDYAANSCCESTGTDDDELGVSWGKTQCLCDYYTYTSEFLQIGEDSRNENCVTANGHRANARLQEITSLQMLYVQTGGQSWLNNTGWLDERVGHCRWHGVTCNAQGFVTDINLRGNNLEGGPPSAIDSFSELTSFNLAENKLTGPLNSTAFYKLQSLFQVDISMNMFTGHADMYFSSSIMYVNYSSNHFSSAGFKRFNPAYKTMRVVDLSNNELDMEAEDLFRNLPVNVAELVLSNNTLRGAFPDPFPSLGELTRFAIDNNDIKGPMPLDFANFMDLAILNLAGNHFSGSIPPDIGNLEKLVVLNVTSNRLSSLIPASLGNLTGVIKILDLSNNMLEGRIPGEIGNLRETIVLLGANLLTPPAPIGVCKIATVQNDGDLCPPEIKILEAFYLSFNGPEWVNNRGWLDDTAPYCSWFGVTCDEFGISTTKLELGNNGLTGKLGTRIIDILSQLDELDTLDLKNNDITGSIPTDIATLSKLSKLDLSRQTQGLVGEIPEELTDLGLSFLNLAHNRLEQTIPSAFGTFDEIKVLDLSSNDFSQSIPSELGRLKDTLISLDLSSNKLEGRIPSELGKFEDIVLDMGGNEALSGPAPLSICLMPATDLTNDTRLCPPERNVLREIYVSAKGREWTKSSLWLDEYASHCLWFGVKCDKKDEFIVKLNLQSNGLSGTLSPNISGLSFMEHLDLSDNDIKGTIPTEIGRLSNLNFLRLCYNRFVGDTTNFGHDLKNLELLHLHSNLLSGSIASIDWPHETRSSSYITDCGNPTEFEQSLVCDDCTMCCKQSFPFVCRNCIRC